MLLNRLSRLAFLPAMGTLAAALLAPLPSAAAQMGLPREVVTAESIGPSQQEQITRHVEEWLPRLAPRPSGEGPVDATELRRAREALLLPLRERGVSVAFRQAYGERLAPGLRQHVQGDREVVVANALRIAGELATPTTWELLEQKLRDGQPAARYAAVHGISRIFGSVRDHSPAMGRESLQQVIARLGRHMETERDAKVLDGCIRALMLAMEIDRPNYDEVRHSAFATIARTAGERARRLEGGPEAREMIPVLLRAGQVVRDAIPVNAPRLRLSDEHVRLAAEMSGHLLAYVVRRRESDFPLSDTDARQLAAQLVAVAEASISLAATRFGVQMTPPNLAADLTKGSETGDREFFNKAVDLFNMMTRAPFSFPAGHFLR
jgi:hypothetical protein